jgi:hypothetical protein
LNPVRQGQKEAGGKNQEAGGRQPQTNKACLRPASSENQLWPADQKAGWSLVVCHWSFVVCAVERLAVAVQSLSGDG